MASQVKSYVRKDGRRVKAHQRKIKKKLLAKNQKFRTSAQIQSTTERLKRQHEKLGRATSNDYGKRTKKKQSWYQREKSLQKRTEVLSKAMAHSDSKRNKYHVQGQMKVAVQRGGKRRAPDSQLRYASTRTQMSGSTKYLRKEETKRLKALLAANKLKTNKKLRIAIGDIFYSSRK